MKTFPKFALSLSGLVVAACGLWRVFDSPGIQRDALTDQGYPSDSRTVRHASRQSSEGSGHASGPSNRQTADSFAPHGMRGAGSAGSQQRAESGVPDSTQILSGSLQEAAVSASAEPLRLQERAQRVENEANRELERLVPLLNLTEDQQGRVFEKLAQNSVYWSAGMLADGAHGNGSKPVAAASSKTGTTSSNGISPATQSIPDLLTGGDSVLTPDQTEALLADEVQRREWWAEVLGQLQSDIDAGPGSTLAAASGDSSLPVPPTSTQAASSQPGTGTTTPVSLPPVQNTTVEGAESVVD